MSNKIFLQSFSKVNVFYTHTVENSPFDAQLLHTHECCEIYCVIEGSGRYITEGNRHKLKNGNVFLMRPGEFHMPLLGACDVYDRLSIHFDISLLRDGYLRKAFFDRPLGQKNVYDNQVVTGTGIYEAFKKMDEIDIENENANDKILILFYYIVNELNTLFERKMYNNKDTNNQSLNIILSYISNNISTINSVDEICKVFHVSRSKLNRDFNALTGASPWDYITNKRLILAREYIKSNIPLTDVSEQVGFKDYSSFYRAYIKKFGTKPSVEF